MNALRLLAIGMTVCVWTASAPAEGRNEKPDNAKLLLGQWEVTRAEREVPVGTVIEFSKDGKMKITFSEDGKKQSLDAVYKIVAFDGRPVLKLSTSKSTLPGSKQVWRRRTDGTFAGDVVALADH